MSEVKWMIDGPQIPLYHNSMINTYCVTDLAKLADSIVYTNAVSLFFGSVDKWLASITYYPFRAYAVDMNNSYTLAFPRSTFGDGYVGTDIPVELVNSYITYGLYLGEAFIAPKGDFTDYEPYTQIKVYLPFYGYIDVPAVDVMSKYLQFRMTVDLTTGQAVYYVGVSDASIPWDSPYRIRTSSTGVYERIDDSSVRIIGKYAFQLGHSIPVGQTDAAAKSRNGLLAAVKLGGALMGAPTTISVSDTTREIAGGGYTYSERNPETGRLVQTHRERQEPRTESYQKTTQHKAGKFYSIFDASVNTLSTFNTWVHTDKPNDPAVDTIGPQHIVVVIKRAKVVDSYSDPTYGRLYGYPLGATYRLDILEGYTEIETIDLGNNEAGASWMTTEELNMIESLLSQGFYI